MISSRNKFHNKQTEYKGIKYHSAKEARYAAELDYLRMTGRIKEWKRQTRIPLVVNGVRVCTYVIDFMFVDANNVETYVEVKGAETQLWKLKWALFDALYPKLNKIVVR